MGTRDTVKTAVFISAFLCLVFWNAVLQTSYESNLKEVERHVNVHDNNFEQVAGKLKRYDNNFQHMEIRLETHESNFEHVKGKFETHNNKFKEHRILIKSIDEAASRRIKRSLDTQPQITGGATYIRWGRTVCPSDDAELIYTGVAGSRNTGSEGGGSEYLCLSDDPKYANYGSGHSSAAHMYGVELKLTGMSTVLLETTNAKLSPLDNSDVQCAVCRRRSKTSMVMIPGTNECSSGWNMEYWGYLMTRRWNQWAQHSYACLDHAPEAGTDGGAKAEVHTAVVYHVLGRCGSLPCQPYVEGYELTCVVCTK